MPGKTGLPGGKAVMKYFFGSKLARGGTDEFVVAVTSIWEGEWSIVFSYTYISMYLQTFSLLGMLHTNQ
jgi:hypothetical protein